MVTASIPAEPATEHGLETALRPFIEKFVKPEKRDKCLAHFLPKSPQASFHELIMAIDTSRARPYSAGVLEPWNDVRGVFLVDHDAFSLTTRAAMELYVPSADAIFVAYRGTFAVVRYLIGTPLLLT